MNPKKIGPFLICAAALLVLPLFLQLGGNAWVRIVDMALLYVLQFFSGSSACSFSQRRQARSATRSPSRPDGRSVSTKISTMKAKMSEYWLPSTPPVSGPM